MKTPAPRLLCALFLCVDFAVLPAGAKPPVSAAKDAAGKPSTSPTPTSSPAPDLPVDIALARWLVQTPSGGGAILLPFTQVVTAATGKRVLPFDPANAADAATLTKIGAALDNLLPRMNRPDSPARAAFPTAGKEAVCTVFDGELRAALQPSQPSGASATEHLYPAFALPDAATGKAYYLAVTLYPTGGDPAATAVNFQPGEAASRISADGCCLLVGIEHNGKAGHDIAFLNWQVLDLAKLKVRFTPVFQANGADALQPGAILTDGRKGRD